MSAIGRHQSHQMPHFSAKMHQIQFRLELHPRPRWEAYSTPPDLLAGGEGASCPLAKNPAPALVSLGLDTSSPRLLRSPPGSRGASIVTSFLLFS